MQDTTPCELSPRGNMRIELNRKVPQTNRLSLDVLDMDAETQTGTAKLEYVPTEDNVPDIFTKPATKVKLEKFKPFIMGK